MNKEEQKQQKQCKCVQEGEYEEYENGLCFYCWNEKKRQENVKETIRQRHKEGTAGSTVLC